KALGARHRDKGVQIRQVNLHCSPLRTARTNYGDLSHKDATLKLVLLFPVLRRWTMSSVNQSGKFNLGDCTVNRLGYGAMQLAGPGVFGPPKDRGAALAVLREAVASGVNHIDTSDFYGPHVTNQIIAEALHPYSKDLVIVTKVGAARGDDASWRPSL